MGWFRSNLRSGAWCALFAMALQLALSFGHVHLNNLVSQKQAPGISEQAPATGPNGEPGRSKSGAAHDPCFICRLIHLADTLVPAALPSLSLPVVASPIRHAIEIDREPAASRPSFFHARAPPLA